jgi:hypothetical protein
MFDTILQGFVMGQTVEVDGAAWILLHQLPSPRGRPDWPRFYLAIKTGEVPAGPSAPVHMLALTQEQDPFEIDKADLLKRVRDIAKKEPTP